MNDPRPTDHEYLMAIAIDVAARSNCLKIPVGAVIAVDGRTRSVGYNGTIEGFPDCFDGGCPRCKDHRIHRGEQLDRCICVHAEQNAIIAAGRYGIPIEGADLYVTHEPCLECTKSLIQAKIKNVYFWKKYDYSPKTDHAVSRKRMRESRETKTDFAQIELDGPDQKIPLEKRYQEITSRMDALIKERYPKLWTAQSRKAKRKPGRVTRARTKRLVRIARLRPAAKRPSRLGAR